MARRWQHGLEARDAVLASFLVVAGLADFVTDELSSPVTAVEVSSIALIGLSCVPIGWRRAYPVPVLALTAFPLAVVELMGPDSGLPLPVFFALYTVAAYVARPKSIVALGAVLVVVFVVVLPDIGAYQEWLASVVVFLVVWIVGDAIGTQRLDREQRTEAREREALQRERARIARELHDVVAHSMSVLVIQATAARENLSRSDESTREALSAIEGLGRAALTEMRTMLGVLRSDDNATDGLVPQPAISGVDDLLEHVRAVGIDASLKIEGTPRDLPAGVALSAYRIVQESLTNVVKHAAASRVEVALGYAPTSLNIDVTDNGRGPLPTADGGGHGLLGMAERVSLFGGSLDTGEQRGGGFQVRASLPTP